MYFPREGCDLYEKTYNSRIFFFFGRKEIIKIRFLPIFTLFNVSLKNAEISEWFLKEK